MHDQESSQKDEWPRASDTEKLLNDLRVLNLEGRKIGNTASAIFKYLKC